MQVFNIEIVINGTIADYKADDMVLTFESSKVAETSLPKGFSQMLRLPKTANNSLIFYNAGDLHAYQRQIYQPFEVKLLINKVSVLTNAKGYLQEVTDTDFLFFIVEHSTAIFEPYKGKKVADFFENHTDSNKDMALSFEQNITDNILYPLADFKGIFSPKYNTNHSIGAINFSYLMSVLQKDNPNSLHCSLFDRTHPFMKNCFVSFSSVGNVVFFKKIQRQNAPFFASGHLKMIPYSFKEKNYECGFFVATDTKYIAQTTENIFINGVLQTEKIQEFYADLGNISLVILVDNKIVGTFELPHKKEVKINHKIHIENGQILQIGLQSDKLINVYVTNFRPENWQSIKEKRERVIQDFGQQQDIFIQGSFLELRTQTQEAIAPIMIQADSLDFLKELCQIFALTPLKLKDGTYHLKTLDQRLNAPLIDWSDKFISLKKIRFADNSVAKNNIFEFKTQDNQSPRPSVFIFENEHLQEEKTFESKIFYQDYGTTFLKMDNGEKEKVGIFPYFKSNFSTERDNKGTLTENVSYSAEKNKHYFMKIRQSKAPKTLYTFSDDKNPTIEDTYSDLLRPLATPLPINEITNEYAKAFYRLFEQPKIVSCQCYLLLSDIVNFTFFSRIYIKALQGEFIPLKIRYSRYQSQVELLYIPPEYNPIP